MLCTLVASLFWALLLSDQSAEEAIASGTGFGFLRVMVAIICLIYVLLVVYLFLCFDDTQTDKWDAICLVIPSLLCLIVGFAILFMGGLFREAGPDDVEPRETNAGCLAGGAAMLIVSVGLAGFVCLGTGLGDRRHEDPVQRAKWWMLTLSTFGLSLVGTRAVFVREEQRKEERLQLREKKKRDEAADKKRASDDSQKRAKQEAGDKVVQKFINTGYTVSGGGRSIIIDGGRRAR